MTFRKFHKMLKALKNPLRRSTSQESRRQQQQQQQQVLAVGEDDASLSGGSSVATAGRIVIRLYGDVDTPDSDLFLILPPAEATTTTTEYTAEDLCVAAAGRLGIGPLALHLFALATPDLTRWLPPNDRVSVPEAGEEVHFRFRLRLRPHVDHMGDLTFGYPAFNYIFMQMRHDVVSDTLQEALDELQRERVLGLGAIDVHRYGLQQKLKLQQVQQLEPGRFLPPSVSENYRNVKRILLRNGFKTELKRRYVEDCQPVELMMRYIKGLLEYVPNYAIERFPLADHGSGAANGNYMVVDPYHMSKPGIHILKPALPIEPVCRLEDILDISFCEEACRVQINRYEGRPEVFILATVESARSFIALVDAYRRLMVDFYYHVCTDIYSPMVKMLCRNRFHGQVSKDWASDFLQNQHRRIPDNNYLVRQRSNSLDGFMLLYIQPPDSRVNGLAINRLAGGKYQVARSNEPMFDSVELLLRHYETNQDSGIKLKKRQPPPSASRQVADDSGLYLCQKPRIREELEEESEEEEEDEAGISMMTQPVLGQAVGPAPVPVVPQQRSTLRLVSSVNMLSEPIGSGQFTDVYKGFWCKDSKAIQAVAVKQLRKGAETGKTYEALMEAAHMSAFWNTATIVSMYDLCLETKFQALMELAELGPLEDYLRNARDTIYIQHLVTAIEQISQALRYLQEDCQGASSCVHGNIRSRNVLVFEHTTDNLKVKLGDRGMIRLYAAESLNHPYNLERLPWLAPELYRNVNQMTTHSDRFAFGVTLWEIVSRGDRPYLHTKPEMIRKVVTNGTFLDCPKNCPPGLYKLMKQCCVINPVERLSAKEIVRDIRNISQGMDRMISRMEAESHYSLDNIGELPEQALAVVRPSRNAQGMGSDAANKGQHSRSNGMGASDHQMTASSSASGTSNSMFADQPSIEYILRREELQVEMEKKLGEGYYGKVHKGTYKNRIVAVKSLRCINIPRQTRREFENEFKMMTKLEHVNIVTIIGQCPQRNSSTPMLLVMEYVEKGCLLNYLRNMKVEDRSHPQELLRFASEVAEGMLYLSSKNIVHRDLAARNVLVTQDNTMKISDFGLSRLIDPDRNYYKCHNQETEMPFKWCAPESLVYHKFSTKSDIWSYGITVWEIFTFGKPPTLCEDRAMHTVIYQGKRLPQPSRCPGSIYETLMRNCWEYDPVNRPRFQDLVVQTKDFLNQADLFAPPLSP